MYERRTIGIFHRNAEDDEAVAFRAPIRPRIQGRNARRGERDERDALVRAAAFGHRETAHRLIARGANVNGLYGCDGGRFPLSLAAQNGDLQMVQLLVGRGADVNGKDAVGTPLGLARSWRVRDYLIAKGGR